MPIPTFCVVFIPIFPGEATQKEEDPPEDIVATPLEQELEDTIILYG